MLLKSLRRLFGNRDVCTNDRACRARSRVRQSAMVDVLEQRVLLSVVTVTNLQDSGEGSLRAAVAAANANPGADVITFQKGLTGTIGLTSGQLEINEALTIDGTGMSRLTISGSQTSRIFQINPGVAVSIDDLTIANGKNTVQDNVGILVTRGGAILNDGGQLSLNRVKFKNNQSLDPSGTSQVVGGGAIVNSGDAQLTAKDCYFIGNIASGGSNYAFGGAIANVTNSEATIQNCVFIDNVATEGGVSYGGAIGDFGSSRLYVTNSTFMENSARGTADGESAFGGAIATRPGTVVDSGSTTTIDRTQFVHNRAVGASGGDAGGGALYNVESVLNVSQSCFLNNQALGGQGGGDAFGGAVESTFTLSSVLPQTTIRQSQFFGNQAVSGHSGGLAAGGALYNAIGQLDLVHVRISGNLAQGRSQGEGIGGGIFNTGTVAADPVTIRFGIFGNRASTSHNNVYGPLKQK